VLASALYVLPVNFDRAKHVFPSKIATHYEQDSNIVYIAHQLIPRQASVPPVAWYPWQKCCLLPNNKVPEEPNLTVSGILPNTPRVQNYWASLYTNGQPCLCLEIKSYYRKLCGGDYAPRCFHTVLILHTKIPLNRNKTLSNCLANHHSQSSHFSQCQAKLF
jgi:hypothetical protein